MAERILVSTEEIQKAVSSYSSAKDKQMHAYMNLSNAVRELDVNWDGMASEMFKAAFNGLYNNIKMSEVRMEDAISELKKAADIFTEVESKQQSAMGGLEKGSPFSI